MVMNFAFVDGIYSGSSLNILGRNAIFDDVREMPVLLEVAGFSGLLETTHSQRHFHLIKRQELLSSNTMQIRSWDWIGQTQKLQKKSPVLVQLRISWCSCRYFIWKDKISRRHVHVEPADGGTGLLSRGTTTASPLPSVLGFSSCKNLEATAVLVAGANKINKKKKEEIEHYGHTKLNKKDQETAKNYCMWLLAFPLKRLYTILKLSVKGLLRRLRVRDSE
ncbi:unnamed protein product [Dovyalis caffra]|uniref:Dirigent protein n=1 Tax=Dovyalis caffra TaxID=77055 RepID=A0AAV1S4S3_9ROSI|nr:unnamed protein product [Dovyalis caffra]